MDLKTIYEDNDLLVINKPAGIIVFPERETVEKTLIDCLLEKYPEIKNIGKAPRFGIVHRLDKDTSGLILVAKTDQALFFLQKQFKNRTIQKKYLALVVGEIKENNGIIETLIGRSPKDGKKQRVYLPGEPGSERKRSAITEYKVIKRYKNLSLRSRTLIPNGIKNYTLLEVSPKTGRKHQIRCLLAYLGHPIVGDKMYGFKNQPRPKGYPGGLTRHFLHAAYLKIELPNGEIKEFKSELPEDLKVVLQKI